MSKLPFMPVVALAMSLSAVAADSVTDPAVVAVDQFIKEQTLAGKIDQANQRWRTSLPQPPQVGFATGSEYLWVMETNLGTIRIKLMPETAPMHVSSTIYLARLGFYDGLKFHRVIPGFMAQGGCPLGLGNGGPGYKYPGEFDAKVKHDRPYLLSMANAGPGTDGSQFFLTFVSTPHLDGKHTIFGEVIEGQAVVKALEAAGSYPAGKPTKDLAIVKTTIEVKPAK